MAAANARIPRKNDDSKDLNIIELEMDSEGNLLYNNEKIGKEPNRSIYQYLMLLMAKDQYFGSSIFFFVEEYIIFARNFSN